MRVQVNQMVGINPAAQVRKVAIHTTRLTTRTLAVDLLLQITPTISRTTFRSERLHEFKVSMHARPRIWGAFFHWGAGSIARCAM